ncbi:MAG TPA: hypothetical protein V6C65_31265 [Allocoleopsis sp.]
MNGLILTIGLYLASLPLASLDRQPHSTLPTSDPIGNQPQRERATPHTFLHHTIQLSLSAKPVME